MLKIIEDKNLCSKRGVDGMYLPGLEEIIVADRNDKAVLVHEIGHYLYDSHVADYFDIILNMCEVLGVNFWDVVNVDDVSEMVDSYDVLIEELCSYFIEQVFKDFPELILDSVPIFRIILRGCDANG